MKNNRQVFLVQAAIHVASQVVSLTASFGIILHNIFNERVAQYTNDINNVVKLCAKHAA